MIFEDEPYSASQGSYFLVLVSDLMRMLKADGEEGIIRRVGNVLGVDTTAFDCDAYQFPKGKPEIISTYSGDYMICYSWGEYY